MWIALTLALSGCGVLTTTVVVAGAVAVTAADLAIEGAVLVGKGVVKTGEVIIDAVKSDSPDKAAQP